MARFLVLFALCLLPALAAAAVAPAALKARKFHVRGTVYCDTCRAGFETTATFGIQNATIEIECKNKDTYKVRKLGQAVTDRFGNYKLTVVGDQGDDTCDAKLVKSPHPKCYEADPGRSRSRMVFTYSNGVVSPIRYANAMGFLRKEPMPGCLELLKKYRLNDDE